MARQRRPILRRDQLTSPDGLLAAIDQIAPNVARSIRADVAKASQPEGITLHSIMRDFRSNLREAESTGDELREVAHLIDASVTVRDNLENAVMTCFVEGGLSKRLRDHLAPETRAYIRAS